MVLTSTNYPTVTIAIPTYNEAAHIEVVVTGFLKTAYPYLLEILVVDGGSNDGTQMIVEHLAQADARVRLLHNPHKIQSGALNIAIHEACGDIFLRADAHADYASDYIERCVETLTTTNALNVGGAQRFVARMPFQAGVALAARSLLGHGGAKYRDTSYEGYAETVYLGCFQRWALDKLVKNDLERSGIDPNEATAEQVTRYPFDLGQITNQDAELNLRLLKMTSKAIYVSPAIKVWYYPRTNWRRLWRQYFKYGCGRCRTVEHHTGNSPLRGRLPFLVLSFASSTLLIDNLFLRGRIHTRVFLALGIGTAFAEGLWTTWKNRRTFATEIWRGKPEQRPSLLERWWWCSIALLTKPVAHFAGYGYQLYRIKVLKRDDC